VKGSIRGWNYQFLRAANAVMIYSGPLDLFEFSI
jgi:hypothetical protein